MRCLLGTDPHSEIDNDQWYPKGGNFTESSRSMWQRAHGKSESERVARSVTWSGRAHTAMARHAILTRVVFALFPLSTALWSSRPSHARPILSFPHNTHTSQVTKDFHKPFRRFWPRFQPKFCPPCGDCSRQEGQTRTRTLSNVKWHRTR